MGLGCDSESLSKNLKANQSLLVQDSSPTHASSFFFFFLSSMFYSTRKNKKVEETKTEQSKSKGDSPRDKCHWYSLISSFWISLLSGVNIYIILIIIIYITPPGIFPSLFLPFCFSYFQYSPISPKTILTILDNRPGGFLSVRKKWILIILHIFQFKNVKFKLIVTSHSRKNKRKMRALPNLQIIHSTTFHFYLHQPCNYKLNINF